ncbi:MAG: DUF4093 domain-containing protein [Clostridiales bacterium]|nr:DUF4093 domain-containing protein [Clostridiales bacterium]
MIKIDRVVIVEGKYDKIRLTPILDAVIIETDGFGIFRDKAKQKLIRRLAETKGLLILTDSDSAGFKIRSFIGGSVPPEKVVHAYIPDIFGKERRKVLPSKEGKLGVEGISDEVLIKVLTNAGVTCTEEESRGRKVTVTDLYEDGISGGADSKSKRTALLKRLDLPERLSTSSLIKMINIFMTYDEYKDAVKSIDQTAAQKGV